MSFLAKKRFYETAGVEERAEGFALVLDGCQVRTPGGAALLLPSRPLAEALADEWRAQEEEIRPQTMPLTKLANTALDLVAGDRAALVDHVLAYAGSDLLCYHAEAPEDLAARQGALWRPLLRWLDETFGARLRTTAGIIHVTQPPQALEALRDAVEGLDAFALTALAAVVDVAGSLVVGLALVEGRLNAAEAFEVSQLDETYQIESWGEDAEAAARRETLRRDLDAAERFLALARA